MKKVLFFTCEPGGAEVLIPLIDLLKQYKEYEILVLTYGYAVARFNKYNIKYEIIQPIEKNDFKVLDRYSPDIIITSATSLPYKDMSEKYLWYNAKQKGIKTFAMLDQWQNYSIRFSGKEDDEILKYQPDLINCINSIGMDEMLQEGFKKDKLISLGQPYLTSLLKNKKTNNKSTKSKILFVSEAIRENYGSFRGYDQYIVLDLLLSYLKKECNNKDIILKLHPKDDINKFKNILYKYKDLSVEIIQDEKSSLEVILESDIVLGMTSIMLIESYILGKYTMSFQPNLKVEDPLILSRLKYIDVFYTEEFSLNTEKKISDKKFDFLFDENKFLNLINRL